MKGVGKKLLAVFLACAMMLPMTVSALAMEVEKEINNTDPLAVTSDGQSMDFEIQQVGENEYQVFFYMDRELVRIHTIDVGKSIRTVDQKTGETVLMEIPDADCLKIDNSLADGMRVPVRWTHLGYMHYKYSSKYGCESIAAISCRSTSCRPSTYYVDTAVSRKVDTAVTLVAGVILGELIGPYIAAEGALRVAQLIVGAMISENNAEVIGGTISNIFKDSYDCTVTDYQISTQVLGTGISNSSKVTYSGTVYTVDYGNKTYAEEPKDGSYHTPITWKNPAFSKEIWKDSLSNAPAWPGIYLDYPYDYPL